MVQSGTSSKGDDNSTGNKADRAAIIVRKADLENITAEVNDLLTVITAELSNPTHTATELRKILLRLRALQTKKTGTASL